MEIPAVGARVTVRHRVDGGTEVGSCGEPVLADVVATVVAVDALRIELRRDDGSEASVRSDRVVTWRLVPPALGAAPGGRSVPPALGAPVGGRAGRSPRRPAVATIERLAAAGWPATETAALGDWELRAAGGWTRRANSALALGHPGSSVADAAAACAAWYRARGLPPLISVVTAVDGGESPDQADIGGALADLGWSRVLGNVVLTARTADVLAGLEPASQIGTGTGAEVGPGTGAGIVLAPRTSSEWLADYRDAATHPAARAVLDAPGPPARVRFATLGRPGPVGSWSLLARGRAVTLGGWTGLSAVAVAGDARRRGLGTATVATLLLDGLRHDGVRSYVQVEAANATALEFWQRLRYRPSHGTAYWQLTVGSEV